MRISRIIVILAALTVIAAFFLPYVSTTAKGKLFLMTQKDDDRPFESVNMSKEDYEDISLFEYAKVYYQGGEEIFGDTSYGLFYTIFFCLVAAFAVLVLLMALINKPILAIIFSILSGVTAYLIQWDFVDRGIMPQDSLKWGIGYYLLYACAGIMFICSIWMLIDKIRAKRKLKESIT